jgi:hypothetical protein
MPIPSSIKAISGSYADIALNKHINLFIHFLYHNFGVGRVGIGIFYLSGEPTLMAGVGRP